VSDFSQQRVQHIDVTLVAAGGAQASESDSLLFPLKALKFQQRRRKEAHSIHEEDSRFVHAWQCPHEKAPFFSPAFHFDFP